VRDIIRINAVKAHNEGNDVAYIKITTFNEQTHTNLAKAVEEAKKTLGKDLKGYVIDLRNNPGGLLDQAIAVSDDFLERGAVVLTKGRNNEETQRAQAHPGDATDGKKVVVLINGGSASASEIVAGALQDHKRAVVIGTQTFGKGSVQTIMPLGNNTAIKLTTARYYTPSGRSIQAKGITPDLIVEEPGTQLARLREADLQRHLANGEKEADKTAPRAKPAAVAPATPAEPPKPIELGSKDDFQLAQAIAHLKGEPVKGQPPAVAQTKPAAKTN
jgi:carboxyl-terminal processing protease